MQCLPVACPDALRSGSTWRRRLQALASQRSQFWLTGVRQDQAGWEFCWTSMFQLGKVLILNDSVNIAAVCEDILSWSGRKARRLAKL